MQSKAKSKLFSFLKLIGPGLVTGASDDDPSGIATYSQAGAQYGTSTLWTALITFPLMACIQEMCARIGLVTSQGLTTNIRNHYPKWLLYLMILFMMPAVILNIGADIAGMGAVGNLLIPSIPSFGFAIGFTVVLMLLIVFLPYSRMAAFLKYMCVFLLLYLVVPFLVKQKWLDIIKHTFVPSIEWNKSFINMLVAILGTTISPYLFFWQATMEAEDVQQKKKRLVVNKHIIWKMGIDVNTGMLFSNIVMFFTILTAGTILHNAGITNISSVEQAAKALEPLAGKFSYLLFSLGIIGTGFLAVPVLCGSIAYIISETFKWNGSLDKKYYQAKPFYLVIIVSLIVGLLINYFDLSPIQALIYSALLYGVTAPPLITIVLHVANNKEIMGEHCNGKWSNIFGVLTLLLMTGAVGVLIWIELSPEK